MKKFIMRTLNKTGVLPALVRKRDSSFILMFHGIGEDDVPLGAFRRMLIELGKVFEFSPLDHLVLSERDRRKPRIYLTFDDGLKNQWETAYPVLEEMAIPATFYVCPGLIDSGSGIWTWELKEMLEVMEPGNRKEIAAALGCESADAASIMASMLELAQENRIKMEQLARSLAHSARNDTGRNGRYRLMDWGDLRRMDPALITIGSHTLTHPMVDSLTPDQAEHEISGSRALLETRLGRPVHHFCYPNGRVGPVAEEFVRKSYLTAVTTCETQLADGLVDRHLLPRVSAARNPEHMWWKLLRTAGPG